MSKEHDSSVDRVYITEQTLLNPNSIRSPSLCDENVKTELNESNEVSVSDASPIGKKPMSQFHEP